MIYNFKSIIHKEGNRSFIKIPFNVWEKCGQKGLIPVEVEVSDISFECKLVPKGKGIYYIPVTNEICKNIDFDKELDVHFKIIDGLSRINSNSPYSKENPIRKIDGITYLKQHHNECCGQTCLAMLAGISVDEVIKIMKSSKHQASISKVIETLDYFGFSHEKPVYTKGKNVELPKCCIINVRGENKSHLSIYYDGEYYDPTHGVLQVYPYENLISYIEISV
jgi:hypothetical protein